MIQSFGSMMGPSPDHSISLFWFRWNRFFCIQCPKMSLVFFQRWCEVFLVSKICILNHTSRCESFHVFEDLPFDVEVDCFFFCFFFVLFVVLFFIFLFFYFFLFFFLFFFFFFYLFIYLFIYFFWGGGIPKRDRKVLLNFSCVLI